MTPEQLDLIRTTTRDVDGRAERFSVLFYQRLFELAPDARRLFPTDLAAQRGKLAGELVFLAEAATDLPAFLARARDLGARHHGYGVRTDHYDIVRIALLESLAEVLGSSWTKDTERAWQSLYRLIAETMLEGAAGSLFAANV